MKLVHYALLFLALLCAPWTGCGSNKTTPDAASGGAIATGGISGTGGAIPYDSGVVTATGGALTTSPIDASSGSCNRPIDCTGLTAAQCQDLITNPTCLPDGVVNQDPGPGPLPPYPTCAAQ